MCFCNTDADLSTHLGPSGLLVDALDAKHIGIAAGSWQARESVVVQSSSRSARGRLFIYLWKKLLPELGLPSMSNSCCAANFNRGVPLRRCPSLGSIAPPLRSPEFRPEFEGADGAAVHDDWIDAAVRAGFQQVGIRAADVLPRTLARATDRGLGVREWGVKTEEDLEKGVRLGAVGATVDWPGRAIELIAKMGVA